MSDHANSPVPPTIAESSDLPPLPASVPRRHDLDALRAVAMLLGIVLHAALSFIPGLWMVKDSHQHEGFGIFVAAVHGFRMPLFFLLSGFFTAMLWRKRGLKALLGHRFKRIFLPLILGMITVVPAVIMVSGWAVGTGIASALEKNKKDGWINAEAGARKDMDIWTAARTGDEEAITRLAAAGTDLDAGDPFFGSVPISVAAVYGQLGATKALIDAGANVNARNKDGGTALHGAAFLGHADILELLLGAGADFGQKNKRGETAMNSLAAPWELTKFVARLLKIKIDKDAVISGRKECAKLLVAQGAKVAEAPTGSSKKSASKGLVFLLFLIPIFHHLWFLWFLCWLVAGFAIYALLMGGLAWKSAPGWLVVSPLRFLWLIPLTMIPQWFMGRMSPSFGPDTSVGLIPMPHVLLYYAIFFGFGALYFDSDDDKGRLGKWWYFSLPIALLVLFPIGLELTHGGLGILGKFVDEESRRPLAVAVQVLYAWMMSFAFIGMFRSLLGRESKTTRYLSDSAYWLYLAHLPLIIGAQAIVRDWPLPAFVKCSIICLGVTGLLLVVYQYLVRYRWLGRLLNGARTRQ